MMAYKTQFKKEAKQEAKERAEKRNNDRIAQMQEAFNNLNVGK